MHPEWVEEMDSFCKWNKICIFLGIIIVIFLFILYVFNNGRVLLQKCQVISDVGPFKNGNLLEFWLFVFLQCTGKDGGGGDGRWQRYGNRIW